jgi:hypothetical protein
MSPIALAAERERAARRDALLAEEIAALDAKRREESAWRA